VPKPDRRTSRAPQGATRGAPKRPGQRTPQRGTRRTVLPDDAPETEVRSTSWVTTGSTPAVPASRRSWRPRLTGRAAVLVLVLAVLTVSYASSLKAYLEQRQHIAGLKEQIAQSEADIASLEREKARWRDPAYVQSQARERFGYLMPGETSYVVLGADGKPLESQTSLRPKKDVLVKEPTAWWQTAWDSVLLAGNPPAPEDKPQPLRKIGPPKE
jgi:cell division protein FtsB